MKELVEQFKNKSKLKRHLRTAVIVGIVLNIINQWNAISVLDFKSLEYPKFVLTFFVPFAVSIYSASRNTKM